MCLGISNGGKEELSYLMSPEDFMSLSCVRGFNHLNGSTYQKHIAIIMEARLTSEQSIEIMGAETPEAALQLVQKYGINITHKHEEIIF
jgi:hypothetical protein